MRNEPMFAYDYYEDNNDEEEDERIRPKTEEERYRENEEWIRNQKV
jgi:hypothetical protein